ncbi:MAG: DUF4214 domain-containing protein [Actinomycetota bacterium]
MRSLLFVLLAVAGSVAVGPLASSPASASTDDEAFVVLANHDELTADHADVFRLYWAFLDRGPDAAGAGYWVETHDRCVGLGRIAQAFADSAEFTNRYGELGDRGFVQQIYRNMLHRAGEDDGVAYWSAQLRRGRLDRGGVALHMALSPEFKALRPYPSDGVARRSCVRGDGAHLGRSTHSVEATPLVTVAGLTLSTPATFIERAGFHQSSHPGALAMTALDPSPVRISTMASRGRGTHPQGAIDIATEPSTPITAPISGTVIRAGSYNLYCRYTDGFVVISPDGRPDLEVKVLHVQGVAVSVGQRVETGQRIAANATTFPFVSQIDRLTAEPSWPHVHIEVVDPSVPRRSSGGSC